MATHRAIQSAVFYYLSCAPCLDARYRKKRKQEAVRSRAERALLEQEHPNLYRHPSPSSTNPYWNTEIALGPNLIGRGNKRRAQNAEGRRSKAGRLSTNASGNPSSIDLPAGAEKNDSRWNLRPYQREDEELWGSTSNLDGSVYAESIRRPAKARTREDSTSDFRSFRNPPINDLHPATVTKVNSREEVLWMLQPPPVAEVMSGKERAPRSRSDSGASRMSPVSALSRQVSSRMAQQRLRASSGATPMSRQTSSRASNRSTGQPHEQSATTNERDFAIIPISSETISRPSLIATSNGSDGSADTVLRRVSLTPEPYAKQPPKRISSRPQLSTIASDNSIPVQQYLAPPMRTPTTSKENSQPSIRHSSEGGSSSDHYLSRRSTIFVDGESFHVVQQTRPKSQVVRTVTAPDMPGHRSEDSSEDVLKPEMFDSWYTPDFELPKWVHEHTKRDGIKQRWSMDL